MHFTMRDPNVSGPMSVLMVLANIINLVYNIPQVVQTYRTKSTGDFSPWFLAMRVIGNAIWIAYAIEIDSLLMLINTMVTVAASLFISYYKFRPYCQKRSEDMSDMSDLSGNESDDPTDDLIFQQTTYGEKMHHSM